MVLISVFANDETSTGYRKKKNELGTLRACQMLLAMFLS